MAAIKLNKISMVQRLVIIRINHFITYLWTFWDSLRKYVFANSLCINLVFTFHAGGSSKRTMTLYHILDSNNLKKCRKLVIWWICGIGCLLLDSLNYSISFNGITSSKVVMLTKGMMFWIPVKFGLFWIWIWIWR